MFYVIVIGASITPCFLDFKDINVEYERNKNIMIALQVFNVIFLIEAGTKNYSFWHLSNAYFLLQK